MPALCLREPARTGGMQVGYLGRRHVPDEPDSLKPWPVEGLGPVVSIAAGRSTAAAATADGAVYTWGSAPLGRTGDGFEPGAVRGLEGHKVVKVCMGEYHGVALTDAGAVFLWGSTGDSQVADLDGVPLTETAAPMRGMPEGLRATAVACGFQHTLLVGSNCSEGGVGDAMAAYAPQQSAGAVGDGAATAASLGGRDSGIASLFSFAPTKEGLFAQPGQVAALPATEPNQQNTTASISSLDPDDSATSPPAGDPPLAAPVSAARSKAPLVPGLLPPAVWSVEDCPNGPRPPWIANCSDIPAEDAISALDRAWLGRPAAPSEEQVRLLPHHPHAYPARADAALTYLCVPHCMSQQVH